MSLAGCIVKVCMSPMITFYHDLLDRLTKFFRKSYNKNVEKMRPCPTPSVVLNSTSVLPFI